jgi:hypothetical protein
MKLENTRRSFMKTMAMVTGTVIAAGSLMGNTACNVFNAIMKYVPVALTAFTTIITMINPAEGSAIAVLASMVKAALADIQTAVMNYENAPSGDKTTLLGKISTAIAAAEQELQVFWSDLKLPGGGLATLVEGIINIILSTLTSFLPQLPPPGPLPTKALLRRVNYSPKKRSVEQFKHDLNAEFVKAGHAQIFK